MIFGFQDLKDRLLGLRFSCFLARNFEYLGVLRQILHLLCLHFPPRSLLHRLLLCFVLRLCRDFYDLFRFLFAVEVSRFPCLNSRLLIPNLCRFVTRLVFVHFHLLHLETVVHRIFFHPHQKTHPVDLYHHFPLPRLSHFRLLFSCLLFLQSHSPYSFLLHLRLKDLLHHSLLHHFFVHF